MKQKILVTGANGQLGMELRELSSAYPLFNFIFLSRQELAIENAESVKHFFAKNRPQYCINCAAYTAVDKAESEKEQEQAFLINAEAVGILAAACKEQNTILIHISTDFVFNGEAAVPYKEDSPADPVSIYGVSKLEGEKLALQNNPRTIIIRTSWVYSSYGKNFVKTMLRLMSEKNEISVVNDQYGSPTYAADLAESILKIINSLKSQSSKLKAHSSQLTAPGGIYHYSNDGAISWYDFALAIKDLSGYSGKINPVSTLQYPTAARRPAYSIMDTSKIRRTFNVELKQWKESLAICLAHIQKDQS